MMRQLFFRLPDNNTLAMSFLIYNNRALIELRLYGNIATVSLAKLDASNGSALDSSL